MGLTASCWLSFGPDLEPLESQARRAAGVPEPRRDGLLVAGTPDEVMAALAAAANGWCRLERVGVDGELESVHVQTGHVRFVVPGT